MSAARLLTGRPMHEPADKLDPEAGSLIWESDKGPMGVDVRIWRELSGDLDVWVYVDWEEWHVESELVLAASVSQRQKIITQT